MKKLRFFIPFLVLLLLFASILACTSKKASSASQEVSSTSTAKNSQTGETVAETTKTVETTSAETQAKGKTTAEVTQISAFLWKDSIDTIWVHGAIEITNTGDTPLKIGNVQISIYDNQNNVLGTIPMVLPIPEILNPGETSYAGDSTILEKIKDSNTKIYAKANIDYDVTDKKSPNLELSKIEGVKDDFFGYKAVGEVKNTTDKPADDIRIIIALLDNNSKLVGLIRAYPQVTLNPGDNMAFETGGTVLPPDINKKVSKVIGKAFNWGFDF